MACWVKMSGSLRLAAVAITVAAALHSETVDAQNSIRGYPQSIRAFDPREVAMLPKYCIYTQDFRERVPGGANASEIERWTSIMGKSFNDMHHYCYGLMKNNRANLIAQDTQTRRFYWSDAVREFDYVLTNAGSDFVLIPEILTKKGEALIRLGEVPRGLAELERAAALKPDYWAPYAAMSDYYKENGDLAKARQTLETGLSYVPDAKGLTRRAAELDAELNKGKSGPTR